MNLLAIVNKNNFWIIHATDKKVSSSSIKSIGGLELLLNEIVKYQKRTFAKLTQKSIYHIFQKQI
jgi:hypothetical protein